MKKQIRKCKKEIQALEEKRNRSQASLVNAILCNKQPSEEDVEYFNRFSSDIEKIRTQMREYEEELKKL